MAYSTVESIVKAAIRDAMKVDTTFPASYIKVAVDFYNASEPFIWRKWPWHNRKVDEISVTPDADGVIVFDGVNSSVDVVRAVRAVDASGDPSVLVWNEDAIRSAINGDDIGSGKFDHLSDDASGNRRIKINADDGVSTYKILAFKRFVRSEVNDSYSAGDPSATPNDYRVLTWQIDRAEAPLIAWIADELREWSSKDKTGRWANALNGTILDIKNQEAHEQLITPDEGAFSETGTL